LLFPKSNEVSFALERVSFDSSITEIFFFNATVLLIPVVLSDEVKVAWIGLTLDLPLCNAILAGETMDLFNDIWSSKAILSFPEVSVLLLLKSIGNVSFEPLALIVVLSSFKLRISFVKALILVLLL